MSNGTELLRHFVEEHSESAFTQIVREHLNLVYSAALRETGGERETAEDISQAVFTELARKAPRLLRHPCLAAWLYTTVRHKAANWRRAERQRRRREEEAQSMNELLSEDSPNAVWQQVRPALDEALHELKEADRAVVVLRFLEDRPLREVGVRLRLNENAARMRAERALEKLRVLLARRGITSTSSGLAAALAIGIITPAPQCLAATIASAALASSTGAASTTLTLMKLASMTKIKAGLAALLLIAGVGAPVWQQTRLQRVEAENARLRVRQTELAALRAEAAGLRQSDADQAELERLRQWRAQAEPELLRLRGMAGVARRAIADEERLRTQLARQTSEAETNSLSGPMADAMKQAMEQQYEGRLSRMTAILHLAPEQIEAARKILMRQADSMSVGMQQAMAGKFNKEELLKRAKEGGDPDERIKALLTPDQKASYQKYQEDESSHTASTSANLELVQLQSSLNLSQDQLDPVYAALYQVSFDQLTGRTQPPSAVIKRPDVIMQWTLDQKVKALESILTPAQLDTYRQQQAAQAQLMRAVGDRMYGTGASK